MASVQGAENLPPVLGHRSAARHSRFEWFYENALGRGSFGTTYLVSHASTGQLAAVKVIRHMTRPQLVGTTSTFAASRSRGFAPSHVTTRETVERELETMKMVNDHCSFPQLIDTRTVGDTTLIIMEYCEIGDLDALLRRLRTQRSCLQGVAIEMLFVQLLIALHFLHGRRMIHRDVKTHNILTKRSGLLKLGDFGLVALNRNPMTTCGTPEYMAPEQWLSPTNGYTSKVDMWAAGVVLYELIAGCRPFQRRDSDHQLCQQICSAAYPPLASLDPTVLDRIDPELLRAVERLLTPSPQHRPSAGELLQEDYFRASVRAFLAGLHDGQDAGQISLEELNWYHHCLAQDGVHPDQDRFFEMRGEGADFVAGAGSGGGGGGVGPFADHYAHPTAPPGGDAGWHHPEMRSAPPHNGYPPSQQEPPLLVPMAALPTILPLAAATAGGTSRGDENSRPPSPRPADVATARPDEVSTAGGAAVRRESSESPNHGVSPPAVAATPPLVAASCIIAPQPLASSEAMPAPPSLSVKPVTATPCPSLSDGSVPLVSLGDVISVLVAAEQRDRQLQLVQAFADGLHMLNEMYCYLGLRGAPRQSPSVYTYEQKPDDRLGPLGRSPLLEFEQREPLRAHSSFGSGAALSAMVRAVVPQSSQGDPRAHHHAQQGGAATPGPALTVGAIHVGGGGARSVRQLQVDRHASAAPSSVVVGAQPTLAGSFARARREQQQQQHVVTQLPVFGGGASSSAAGAGLPNPYMSDGW